MESFSAKFRDQVRLLLLLLLPNILLKVPAREIWRAKEIKGTEIRTEVKVPLPADDLILHAESPKNYTGELLELIHSFSKVCRI